MQCVYMDTLYTHECHQIFFFFFFNDTATTEIYTLSLHDALPICTMSRGSSVHRFTPPARRISGGVADAIEPRNARSEEHTSELQSQSNLVCRLLLEKKKKNVSIVVSRIERLPQYPPHIRQPYAVR